MYLENLREFINDLWKTMQIADKVDMPHSLFFHGLYETLSPWGWKMGIARYDVGTPK